MAEPIIDMVNLQRFLDYILERYKIHLRKDAHQYPITTNVIFQRHKFINICRKHDTQTKNVIKYVVNNEDLTLEDKILNIIMFRGWGIYDTFRLFGGAWTKEELMSPETIPDAQKKYEKILRASPKRRFFTSAAYVVNLKTATVDKFKCCSVISIFHLAQMAVERNIPKKILEAKSEQEVIDLLRTLTGVADTLAYQIFLDLTYIPEFQFTDDNYVVASTRVRFSLRALFKYSDGLSYEECIMWLRDNLSNLAPEFVDELKRTMIDTPPENRVMTLTMLQSSLYGFSDYFKITTRR